VGVVIAGPSGKVKLTTDSEGVYDITGLPPGEYTVELTTKFGGRFAYVLHAGEIGESTFWGIEPSS
jgi:hypothetical protein